MTSVAISALVIAVLVWILFKSLASDRIQRLVDARRTASLLVTRGEFVDDGRRLSVSLGLTEWAIHYESPDMQNYLDLEWIQDVGYGDELLTGRRVGDGNVLRLRCYGQAFEFILPKDALAKWRDALPPRHAAELRHPAPGGGTVGPDEGAWLAPAVAGR